MKLAINQPYFFPYIGYFQLIESVDIFIIYGNLKFVKSTWMTRNRLLNKGNTTPFYISISVENRNKSFQLINEVSLKWNREFWIKKFNNSLVLNYSKALYFSETFDCINSIFSNINTDNLHTFNSIIIRELCKHLRIDTTIILKDTFSDFEADVISSYEDTQDYLIKVHRALKFCKKMKANQFHNLPGGAVLYDKNLFKEHGIELKFIGMPNVQYNQFNHPFVPHLSIIDVLMHNGNQGTKELIKNYQLI